MTRPYVLVDTDALHTFLDTDVHDEVCLSERDHEVVNEVTALIREYLRGVE